MCAFVWARLENLFIAWTSSIFRNSWCGPKVTSKDLCVDQISEFLQTVKSIGLLASSNVWPENHYIDCACPKLENTQASA